MQDLEIKIKVTLCQMDELSAEDQALVGQAIAARNAVGLTAQPVTPCGACRQVALEVEDRYQQPMRVLLYGTEGVYVVGSMHDLVPLSFSDGAMR